MIILSVAPMVASTVANGPRSPWDAISLIIMLRIWRVKRVIDGEWPERGQQGRRGDRWLLRKPELSAGGREAVRHSRREVARAASGLAGETRAAPSVTGVQKQLTRGPDATRRRLRSEVTSPSVCLYCLPGWRPFT